MRTYTRDQIAYLLHLPTIQVQRYCVGYYTFQGEKRWYYKDKHKIESVSGDGSKGHPQTYTLKSFKEYERGL